MDHQPLLLTLTMLILVASSRKLLNPPLSTWGWRSGLEHNSRISWTFLYKRLVVQVTTRFAVEEFFPTIRLTQERENLSTDELPPRVVQDLPLSFFLSYESLKSRKRRIFLPTSYIQGQVRESQGSRWVRQGWSIATRRGREKVKKRKRPRKAGLSPQEGYVRTSWKEKDQRRLVYCHKKGTWEKEEKKRKRPRKARRWLQRRQGSVCPTPRITFFGSQVFGLRSGPTRLKYRLLRDLVYKEAMCKGVPEMDYFTQQKQYLKKDYFTQVEDPAAKHCSKEGPHYRLGAKREESCHETCNKCHMAWLRWKSCCEVFIARKARTNALEQSARKLSFDKRQSTFIHELDILWWFHTWALLRSLANARKCQLEDFCEKERYESCSVQRTFTADAFRRRRRRKKLTVVMLLPDSHEHIAFEKPAHSDPETWGRMYDVLALRN